jgi:hypothetical protein
VKEAIRNIMTTPPVRIECVDAGEAQAMKLRLLPLPHEILIERKAVVHPANVGIRWCGSSANDATSRLKQLFDRKAGVHGGASQFEILAGIVDRYGAVDEIKLEQVKRLRTVPNGEQAYCIEPAGDNTLIVGGLSEAGVRYGITTLCQLIEAEMSRESVSIPLVSILDWPDFDDRGFWHMPIEQVPHLAALKFNQFHCATYFSMSPDGHARPRTATGGQDTAATGAPLAAAIAEARDDGVEVIPGLIHLDFWEPLCEGFTSAYPQMIGKGERAKGGHFNAHGYRVPCASNPQLARTLGALMIDLASNGASQVKVWMSEYPGQCECEACMREGQFQAEVRSTIEAWREARRTYPNLKLRLFFGAGGFTPGDKWTPDYPPQAIDAILATLPKDVRMCVSLGIKEKTLADFAADGGLVTRCFIVTLSFWDRFCCRHIVSRLRNLHTQGMHGMSQFTDRRFKDVFGELDLQLCALAEYSWNAHGRTISDFGAAWATRRGEKDPAAFGQWLSLMSTLVAQSRGMDDLIWSGTWLADLADALAGRGEEHTLAIDPTIERCRAALEYAKYFPAKRLSLRQEIAARSIAYASDISLDQAIECGRQALASAERLVWREPAIHAALLLRYCELEKAAINLIDGCRNDADEMAIRQAHDTFRQAAGAFLDALHTRIATLPTGGDPGATMRQNSIAQLQRRLDEIATADPKGAATH